MDYKRLQEEIKEIASIASSVPDKYREKCFEILLNRLLADTTKPPAGAGAPPPPPPPSGTELHLQGQVLAFMRRKGIAKEQIETILMIEEGNIHFLKEPSHGKAARGQNEWALLLALKNGILNNTLKVDPEDVRSLVQEKGFYNAANFAANFKAPKYKDNFRKPLEPQGEAQALTPAGETALAELIKKLAE
jgi:hypothetical protein